VVLVATADDLPVGAAVCAAHRQDATFVQRALASVVVELPLEARPPLQQPTGGRASPPARRRERRRPRREQRRRPGRTRRGWLTRAAVAAMRAEVDRGPDVRALPYLRGDGNFAKVPARCDAKRQGFRLWAPDKSKGHSRKGLGRVRSSGERAHALVNQFGRVFRRLDRDDNVYLGWVQFACCLIFMRQGFFP
jgi:hypothetical protein